MKSPYLCLVLILLVFSSCKKLGCTDVNSENYEKVAEKSDGSCSYEGSVAIWFDGAKSAEYIAKGVQSITFFVEGKDQGTLTPQDFGNPQTVSCTSPEVVFVDFVMWKAPTKTVTLLVKRETGAIIDDYSITVDGGKCNLYLMK